MKNIGIIGCGWLGLHLAEHLYPTNRIFTTTTSEAKRSPITSKGFDVTIINFPSLEFSKNITTWENLEYLRRHCYYCSLSKTIGHQFTFTAV